MDNKTIKKLKLPWQITYWTMVAVTGFAMGVIIPNIAVAIGASIVLSLFLSTSRYIGESLANIEKTGHWYR